MLLPCGAAAAAAAGGAGTAAFWAFMKNSPESKSCCLLPFLCWSIACAAFFGAIPPYFRRATCARRNCAGLRLGI